MDLYFTRIITILLFNKLRINTVVFAYLLTIECRKKTPDTFVLQAHNKYYIVSLSPVKLWTFVSIRTNCRSNSGQIGTPTT